MKKFILVITIAIATVTANAQIPSPGFETWNTTSFEQIGNWNTLGTVEKATPGQAGSFAVKLTSDFNFGFGEITNGGQNISDGGSPCAQRPDSLVAYFKCNLTLNDSADIYLLFKKSGNLIAINEYRVGGVNTTTWKRLAFKINYILPAAIPDSVVIQIFSTDFNNTQLNNYIIVDNIQLTKSGTPIADQIPNSSFESWPAKSFKEPVGWSSLNQFTFLYPGSTPFPVTQSAGAHAGSFAMRMENIESDAFGLIPGVTVTGLTMQNSFLDVPSFPFTTRYSQLTGFYKFTGVNGDTAFIEVNIFKNGSVVGQGAFKKSATVTTYTPFTCPIIYDGTFTGTPDSATIQMSPCSPFDPLGAGSVLFVDDLAFGYAAGLNEPGQAGINGKNITVMPNPFNEHFILNYEVKGTSDVSINIVDINGKVVKEIKYESAQPGIYQDQIDLSGQSSGIYFYQGIIDNTLIKGKIIKQ